jgi:hypothetical protein
VEFSTPVIVVESTAFPRQVGDQNIFGSVIVEVSGRHSHAGARHSVGSVCGPGHQPRLFKSPIAFIDPQQIGGAVIGYVNINPPVVVEVRASDA